MGQQKQPLSTTTTSPKGTFDPPKAVDPTPLPTTNTSTSPPPHPNVEQEFTRLYQPHFEDDELEDFESYAPGGYHPVTISSNLGPDDRYAVVHKLGHGAYSTVWLCRDNVSNKLVSVKILRASISEKSNELRILEHIRDKLSELEKNGETLPGREYIPTLLDEFFITGPNGRHRCIVTPPTGPNLRRANEIAPGLSPSIKKKIVPQILQAVAFLHKLGVVHGDINRANICLQIPEIANMSDEEVYLNFGEPRREEILKVDGTNDVRPHAPKEGVMRMQTFLRREVQEKATDHGRLSIQLIDFGESFLVHDLEGSEDEQVAQRRKERNIGVVICPPELLIDWVIMWSNEEEQYNEEDTLRELDELHKGEKPLGTEIDVWVVACTIYNILGDHSLFESGFEGDPREVLVDMVSTLGRLPDHFWQAWANRGRYFEENGTRKNNDEIDSEFPGLEEAQTLEMKVKGIMRSGEFCLDEQEEQALLNILKGALRYNPEERVSIEQMIEMLRKGWHR